MARFQLLAVLLVTGAVAPTASAQTWQASTDYSSTQGYNNWRYMTFRTSDSTYGQMVFTIDQWGSETWIGLDQFGNDNGSSIFANNQHPGGSGYEAARVWGCPLAGIVRVTGTVAEINREPRNPAILADGVQASIWKNGELLFVVDIEDSDFVGYDYDLAVDVMPGDWLVFRVQARSTPNYDSTLFDPRITVASLSGSSGASWIADVLSAESAYLAGLDPSLFEGQNDHARAARRLTLSHELQVASNRVSSGESTAAINVLLNVIVRLQGFSPPDWMIESPQKAALRDDVWVLINLLGGP